MAFAWFVWKIGYIGKPINRMDIIKNNYTDIDIYAEKPTANDRFLGRKL